jgi:hypothetical protein
MYPYRSHLLKVEVIGEKPLIEGDEGKPLIKENR